MCTVDFSETILNIHCLYVYSGLNSENILNIHCLYVFSGLDLKYIEEYPLPICVQST